MVGLPSKVCPDLYIHTFPPLSTHPLWISKPNSFRWKISQLSICNPLNQVLIPVSARAITFIICFQRAEPVHSLRAETERTLKGACTLETHLGRSGPFGDVKLSNHLPVRLDSPHLLWKRWSLDHLVPGESITVPVSLSDN